MDNFNNNNNESSRGNQPGVRFGRGTPYHTAERAASRSMNRGQSFEFGNITRLENPSPVRISPIRIQSPSHWDREEEENPFAGGTDERSEDARRFFEERSM